MLILVFIIGYLLIALEEFIKINKSSIALITGVVCWTLLYTHGNVTELNNELIQHLGEIASILFFLLGAMTIVELIDAHNGFDFIMQFIKTKSKKNLLIILSGCTFFLSAILDNLTTTIVFISIVLKIIKEPKEKIIFASMIVIAANAGGVWSPIGDVTTTMLWMGNQITTSSIVSKTFLASLISVAIPLVALSVKLKGNIEHNNQDQNNPKSKHAISFFLIGIGGLLFVPIFKSLTGLPPFMGILLEMGAIWLFSELIDRNKDEEEKNQTSIHHVLKKIDTPSILFFLGILLAVAALSAAGSLQIMASNISTYFSSIHSITMMLGMLSAIIDNVPLVAATQNMYELSTFPTDHPFWLSIAFTTGVGGSLLIIGSAAGVAAMGMTQINFFWYLKNVSLWVLLGYLSGWMILSVTLGG